MWDIRVYISEGYDAGNIFRIRQIKKAVPPMQGLSPTELLVPFLLHPFSVRRPTPVTPQAPLAFFCDGLFKLVSVSFSALNFSQPSFTKDCWLCLSSNPPFYEAVASNGTISLTSDQAACQWRRSHEKITLLSLVGTGLCIG